MLLVSRLMREILSARTLSCVDTRVVSMPTAFQIIIAHCRRPKARPIQELLHPFSIHDSAAVLSAKKQNLGEGIARVRNVLVEIACSSIIYQHARVLEHIDAHELAVFDAANER